jgi:peroxiredoxin
VELRDLKPEFDRRGATVVLVSLASPHDTRAFAKHLGLPFTCVSTADGVAHRAFGVRKGSFAEIIGLKVLAAGVRAFFSGHRQGRAKGDVRVLPGTFVVDGAGRIVAAHYGANSADHMKARATLAAIDRSLAEPS